MDDNGPTHEELAMHEHVSTLLWVYHEIVGGGPAGERIPYEEQLIHHAMTTNSNKVLFGIGGDGAVIVSALILSLPELLHKNTRLVTIILLECAPWVLSPKFDAPAVLQSVESAHGTDRARRASWVLIDIMMEAGVVRRQVCVPSRPVRVGVYMEQAHGLQRRQLQGHEQHRFQARAHKNGGRAHYDSAGEN